MKLTRFMTRKTCKLGVLALLGQFVLAHGLKIEAYSQSLSLDGLDIDYSNPSPIERIQNDPGSMTTLVLVAVVIVFGILLLRKNAAQKKQGD